MGMSKIKIVFTVYENQLSVIRYLLKGEVTGFRVIYLDEAEEKPAKQETKLRRATEPGKSRVSSSEWVRRKHKQ